MAKREEIDRNARLAHLCQAGLKQDLHIRQLH
jgi:hypothetical protein